MTRSGTATSLVTMASGVSLAVIPAASVSIAARLFTEQEQGVVAVAIMTATFCGQLLFAGVIESRLASSLTERRVVMPRWLAAAAVLAAALLAVLPPSVLLVCLALPVLLAALEIGRGVSIAERLDRREWVAGMAVGLGAIGGVAAGFAEQQWAFAPLAAGILIATALRALRVGHRASAPDRRARRWVLADTAVTGAVYPLLNAMILGSLGAANAVQFTAIATVSGLLAIPLNFLRLRLLKEHSTLDIAVSAAAVVGAVLALVVAHLSGAFGLLFGSAWSGSDLLLALLLACAWRAGSLATTVPFAALRRGSAVRLVTALRAGVSLLTFGAAVLGILVGGLVPVFAGLIVAELLSAVVYDSARRRVELSSPSADTAPERPA